MDCIQTGPVSPGSNRRRGRSTADGRHDAPLQAGPRGTGGLAPSVADLHAAQEVAQQIVETVRDPPSYLGHFWAQSANPAFYQLFHVTPAETEGQSLYALGNGQWDIPALRTLLEELLPHHTVFNAYEMTHTFVGPRSNGRKMRQAPWRKILLYGHGQTESVTHEKSRGTFSRFCRVFNNSLRSLPDNALKRVSLTMTTPATGRGSTMALRTDTSLSWAGFHYFLSLISQKRLV